MAVGSGWLSSVVQIPADPGSYAVEVTVSHPLAASEAVWKEAIEVTAEPGAGLALAVWAPAWLARRSISAGATSVGECFMRVNVS